LYPLPENLRLVLGLRNLRSLLGLLLVLLHRRCDCAWAWASQPSQPRSRPRHELRWAGQPHGFGLGRGHGIYQYLTQCSLCVFLTLAFVSSLLGPKVAVF
jgi:hypothetical protein